MRVIFDIDDCLMPWAEQVHEACLAAGLNPTNKIWSQWEMWEDYGCTKEQWLEVVNSLVVEGGLYHTEPYPGTVEAMNKLASRGHSIHLVTARGFLAHGDQIKRWTRDWIINFKIPGTLWFSLEKGLIAEAIGATHAIDDRYENVISLMNAGVITYLLTQPHNVAAEFDPYKRVNSVVEFVERLLEYG